MNIRNQCSVKIAEKAHQNDEQEKKKCDNSFALSYANGQYECKIWLA